MYIIKVMKVPPLVKFNFSPFALSFMRPFHYHALYFQKRAQPSILINCVGAGAACLVWSEQRSPSAMIRPLLLSHKQPPVLSASDPGTWGQ